jgi:hypothetical protein
MSASKALDPPATGTRRRPRLPFALVMAIGLIWFHGVTRGAPGPPLPGNEPVDCPDCGKPGDDRGDGSYACEGGHVFTEEEARAAKKERDNQA